MRSVLCVVALLIVVPVFAGDKRPARELNLTGVKLELPGVRDLKDGLTEIRTADELAKSTAFADDASREAVKRQVDFSREKVVVFTWWGSSSSSARVKRGRDG